MFNNRTRIKELLSSDQSNYETTVMGWVRSFRNNQFIAVNDGSTNLNIQVVAPLGLLDESTILNKEQIGQCNKQHEYSDDRKQGIRKQLEIQIKQSGLHFCRKQYCCSSCIE